MLSVKFKQQLKAQAHVLKPVVIIGNQGLTPAVSLEIDRALHDHELIKIKVHHSDRKHRRTVIEEICRALDAILVQVIGQIGVIYRKRRETK